MKKRKQPTGPDLAIQEVIENGIASSQVMAEAVQNGLADAIGFNAGGFPQNQGVPWSEQISNVNTIFKNLRWYLISNFRQVLCEMYVELGLVQTIVDVPVDDALRGGATFSSKELDEDELKQLQVSMDRDDDLNTAGQAAKWNRLFGGAGVLIMTDQDADEPLDVESIKKDSPFEFRAVDMWELFWDKQNSEGYDPTIQTEEVEYYSYYGIQVHHSRVMRMKGLTAPSSIRPRLRGWGYSVVEKLVRSINQYLKATDLGFEVLDEFKLDVYKFKGLTDTLMSSVGSQKIKERVNMTNWMKNYQNAIVLDKEDDFDHKQLSFSGLAEAMDGIRKQVASDMRMPLTKLFGQSAAGFNSGEDDIEVYNAMVESEVRNKIKYIILRMAELKCQKLFGFIPDDLELVFKPLREMTSVEEETVKTSKFNRLFQAKSAGEITTFEFREGCNKDNLLSVTLDTAGDELNPDDPDVADLLAGIPDPATEDAANRPDSQKPRAQPEGAPPKAKADKDPQGEKIKTTKNSPEYEKAAFEADGGDGQIIEARKPFYEDPVDTGLWARAKAASQKAYGKDRWQFVVWWYKKEGGKFHGQS